MSLVAGAFVCVSALQATAREPLAQPDGTGAGINIARCLARLVPLGLTSFQRRLQTTSSATDRLRARQMFLQAAHRDGLSRDAALRLADHVVGAKAPPADFTLFEPITFGRLTQLTNLLMNPPRGSPLWELTKSSSEAREGLRRAAHLTASGQWISPRQLTYLLEQAGVSPRKALTIYSDKALLAATRPAQLTTACQDVHGTAIEAGARGQRVARPWLERLFAAGDAYPPAVATFLDLLYSRAWGRPRPLTSELLGGVNWTSLPTEQQRDLLSVDSEHPSGGDFALPWSLTPDTNIPLTFNRLLARRLKAEKGLPAAGHEELEQLFKVLWSLGLPEFHQALLPTVVNEIKYVDGVVPSDGRGEWLPIADRTELQAAHSALLQEAWANQRSDPRFDPVTRTNFEETDRQLEAKGVGITGGRDGKNDRLVVCEAMNLDILTDDPALLLSLDGGVYKQVWAAATGGDPQREEGYRRRPWFTGFEYRRDWGAVWMVGATAKKRLLALEQIESSPGWISPATEQSLIYSLLAQMRLPKSVDLSSFAAGRWNDVSLDFR